jgi:hypothetical protein
MQTGQKLEDFTLGGYRVVFLKVTQQSSFIHYHYRLIVFPLGKHEPVLSLNLESNPVAETCCLGAHIGDGHDNLGLADRNMPAKDFKSWGIENAKRYLGLAHEPPPTPEASISMSDSEDVEDEQALPDLPSIASFLGAELKSEREKWFSACRELMKAFERSFDTRKTHVKTTRLDGEASHIIKSFQIVHVLSFINMQGYADERIGQFTRLLCSYVCDADWNQCQPYVQRYTELKQQFRGDRFHGQFLKFSEDLALTITRGPMGMLLAPAIDATVVNFYWRNLLLAACAFGDKETANKLLESIRRLHQSS